LQVARGNPEEKYSGGLVVVYEPNSKFLGNSDIEKVLPLQFHIGCSALNAIPFMP
jgi:hypothetical protein